MPMCHDLLHFYMHFQILLEEEQQEVEQQEVEQQVVEQVVVVVVRVVEYAYLYVYRECSCGEVSLDCTPRRCILKSN